jgi:hypothetical protein
MVDVLEKIVPTFRPNTFIIATKIRDVGLEQLLANHLLPATQP